MFKKKFLGILFKNNKLKEVKLLQTRWLRDWRQRVLGTSVYMPVYVTSVKEMLKTFSEIGLTTQKVTIPL